MRRRGDGISQRRIRGEQRKSCWPRVRSDQVEVAYGGQLGEHRGQRALAAHGAVHVGDPSLHVVEIDDIGVDPGGVEDHVRNAQHREAIEDTRGHERRSVPPLCQLVRDDLECVLAEQRPSDESASTRSAAVSPSTS